MAQMFRLILESFGACREYLLVPSQSKGYLVYWITMKVVGTAAMIAVTIARIFFLS